MENGEPRRESHHIGEQRSFSSCEGGEARSKPQFRGARAQVDVKGGGGSLRATSGGDALAAAEATPAVAAACARAPAAAHGTEHQPEHQAPEKRGR